jgi:hypothetical protein
MPIATRPGNRRSRSRMICSWTWWAWKLSWDSPTNTSRAPETISIMSSNDMPRPVGTWTIWSGCGDCVGG